ncbi:MAG: transglycosylase SLT domain-containing protein [Prevotellaceae bacterium]|jgi:membrane-bound lytic murein transglycosylase F|nr:transglycosylase SLT domain-containing protein [Prevotellaceae bacterium]
MKTGKATFATQFTDNRKPIVTEKRMYARQRYMKKGVWMLLLLLNSCSRPVDTSIPDTPVDDMPQIIARGELRVVTLESALSYYTDGNNERGFDYSLVLNFADYLDIPLRVIVTPNMEALQEALLRGDADFAACRVPCSKSNRELFGFVNAVYMSQPVLVQLRSIQERIRDVTELTGKEVFVKPNTKYWQRMQHLNYEQGGGIIIREAPDSLSSEQLVVEVSKGRLPLTVVDNEIAMLGRSSFSNVDISVAVGLPQATAWAVRKNAPALLDSLNAWYRHIEKSRFYRQLTRQSNRNNSYYSAWQPVIPKGAISPYDSIFKTVASVVGWDWQMLAAVAYHESRFNPETVSSAGAMGLMQLMPRTAARYGLDSATVYQPEANIKAATGYLKTLNAIFAAVEHPDERACFMLAAYNAGQGHVFDAMALARKFGDNPQVWHNSVEKYLKLKSNPLYYNDTVCRYGYFRANHTVRYLNDVFTTYKRYMGMTDASVSNKGNNRK